MLLALLAGLAILLILLRLIEFAGHRLHRAGPVASLSGMASNPAKPVCLHRDSGDQIQAINASGRLR